MTKCKKYNHGVAAVLTFLLCFHSAPQNGKCDIRTTILHLSAFWSFNLFFGSCGPCTITSTLLKPCSKYAEPSAVGTSDKLCLRLRMSLVLLPSNLRPANARMSAFCMLAKRVKARLKACRKWSKTAGNVFNGKDVYCPGRAYWYEKG